ncbi:competence type IV pilus minor pilin ComGG [Bacillus massilinigeriensis]|uniref:competence type IV pilus minor pilin ComGG n=1 Tax=Bacillus massilionigeriensis TaxID=1805475 RepID=UPI0013563DA9|nr:competence type IV pilus minor pilin ComGG [Bacillus massilionigeriensis]
MFNEKGFFYPLTFILVLLFSSFITIQTELYLSEKRLLIETEHNFEKEYYFKLAINDIEEIFNNDGWKEHSGVLTYLHGRVDYSVIDLSKDVGQITIHLTIGERNQVSGFAYYDKNQKKMIKWYENNK